MGACSSCRGVDAISARDRPLSRTPDLRALTIVPALRPLRWRTLDSERSSSFREWRDSYLQNRVYDQSEYFGKKQKEAESERKQLSRWTTLLLDIALAFAFAGVAIAFIPRDWLKDLGDVRLEVILGLAGVVIPVGLLLVQLLRGVEELNRRTARFAQQQQMLQQVKTRLMSLQSSRVAMEIVETTEQHLLAEVLEWYFHAETAEHFFQIRQTETAGYDFKVKQEARRPSRRLVRTVVAKSGWASLFLLRVILGRVPWIVASAAAIVMWLNYYNPSDVTADARRFAELKKRVVIDWRPWNPTAERARNGCVILVHGLYGGPLARRNSRQLGE